MDSSGSIGTEGFESGRIFIRMLVESLDLGEDKVHLGLMQFSSSTQVEFEISDISREDALDKVDSMTYIRGGTVTGLAVQVGCTMGGNLVWRASKHETFCQCWHIAVPSSSTLAQHCTKIC